MIVWIGWSLNFRGLDVCSAHVCRDSPVSEGIHVNRILTLGSTCASRYLSHVIAISGINSPPGLYILPSPSGTFAILDRIDRQTNTTERARE
jgi:hypothetical protein